MFAPALQGCAARSSAALFDVGAGASAELQALSRRAAAGDKQAQLTLGIAFEEGRLVRQDLSRSLKLNDLASKSNAGSVLIYSPAVDGKSSSSLIRIQAGVGAEGLAEASERKSMLLGKMKQSK